MGSALTKILVVVGVGGAVLGGLRLVGRAEAPHVAAREPARAVETAREAVVDPPRTKREAPAWGEADQVALVTAARAGDRATVEVLAGKGVPLDGTLALAAASGNASLCTYLLDHGVDVHEGEGTISAPVLLADAHPEVTKVLLARGAAEPPLDDAITAKALRAIGRAKIADAGALVSAFDEPAVLDAVLAIPLRPDATVKALASAALRHDASLVKKLARKGVAWSKIDDQEPALVVAARDADLDIVRELLAAGAPVEQATSDGETALASLLAHDHAGGDGYTKTQAIAKMLLDRGASPNRRLADGRTPLQAAEDAGHDAIVTLLLKHGARKPAEG
jgi:ankyrin repeat protein